MPSTRRRNRRNKKRNNKTPKTSWGYQLIIDAAQCDPEAIRSKPVIIAFVQELVKRIHMIAYGKPRIVRFGKGAIVGLTLVQLIEKSDITAHFVEHTNDAYIDIFSCKSFNPAIAINVVTEFFSPRRTKIRFLTRQA